MLLSVLHESEKAQARVFVEYEALVQDPASQARRLAQFLDYHCGGTSGDACIAAMAGTCDPALWRIRSPRASVKEEVAPAQAALYRLVRERAADMGVPFDSYPMPNNWRTLVITEEAAARS